VKKSDVVTITLSPVTFLSHNGYYVYVPVKFKIGNFLYIRHLLVSCNSCQCNDIKISIEV